MVAINMPENTVVPMIFLETAPAPLAFMRGTTPKINANAVIKIGETGVLPHPWQLRSEAFLDATFRVRIRR